MLAVKCQVQVSAALHRLLNEKCLDTKAFDTKACQTFDHCTSPSVATPQQQQTACASTRHLGNRQLAAKSQRHR